MVLHHGREGAGSRSRRGAAVCFNGLLGSPLLRSPALTNATKWVGSIAGEEGPNDCASQNDRGSRAKRKLVDAEEPELPLPIGSDEDADECAEQEATREQRAGRPAIGGPNRVMLHGRRIAAVRQDAQTVGTAEPVIIHHGREEEA